MKAIGIDLGERRVGVAVSDPDGIVATPYAVIDLHAKSGSSTKASSRVSKQASAEASSQALCQKLQEIASEIKAEAVVVGMPFNLDGTSGRAARSAEVQIAALSKALDIPVLTHDERFTTTIAERAMLEADLSRKRRKRSIDKSAATIMLQSWLDAQSA